MRLWTVQTVTCYQRLLVDGIVHCQALSSFAQSDPSITKAYEWMAGEMGDRLGPPPAGARYPFWAWYRLDGRNRKPGLHRLEFRSYGQEHVCLELDMPTSDVLLSDEELWHLCSTIGIAALKRILRRWRTRKDGSTPFRRHRGRRRSGSPGNECFKSTLLGGSPAGTSRPHFGNFGRIGWLMQGIFRPAVPNAKRPYPCTRPKRICFVVV